MNRSLDLKILLLALALLLILVILIFKAVMIRQRKVAWLEDLNRRVAPLAAEELAGAPEGGTPRRPRSPALEGGSAPEAFSAATAAPVEKDTPRADGIGLDRANLERILDSLPPSGRMGRLYFMRLGEELELCCRQLGSPDPVLQHRGELISYRLARRMVEDRGSGGRPAADMMDRYGAAFIKEFQGICLRRRFEASAGRSKFICWAAAATEGAEEPVLVFLVRILGIAGDRSSMGALRSCRSSREPGIRNAAVWAMGMQGSTEVIGEIERILADPSLPAGEGEAFLAALERIGGRRADRVLGEVAREGRPLLAYGAYQSLRKMSGQPERAFSLEEFEQGRTVFCEEIRAWQEAEDAKKEGEALRPPP